MKSFCVPGLASFVGPLADPLWGLPMQFDTTWPVKKIGLF